MHHQEVEASDVVDSGGSSLLREGAGSEQVGLRTA